MKCLLTYEDLKKNEKYYSKSGLHFLHPKLEGLKIFPYSQDQQNQEAQKLAGKISIQGVQPKLSARLNIKENKFELVERGGTFIMKPQTANYPELPQNEDLTMHLAALAGIEVPWHGLIVSQDKSLTYVIKRFDRRGRGKKIAQEDFAQLIGASRTTKYEASMEKVAEVLDFCSFPTIEAIKLFDRIIFSFLVGNEDMHLKNFSLTRAESGKVMLTPAYDFLNSTIAMASESEELALSLNRKRSNFNPTDFISYAISELYMPEAMAKKKIRSMLTCVPVWLQKIESSFLSAKMKKKYSCLVKQRAARLKLGT